MFNIEGSELIFLVLIALIVLGPEKLPDAIRKAGRAYAEFKKMANGFQGELRQALDEPMRELRDTADAMRAAANFDLSADDAPAQATPEAPVQREAGLNFGSANPRRSQPAASASDADTAAASTTAEPERPQGLNFGSANPRRREKAEEPASETAPDTEPVVAIAEPPAPPVKKERPPGGTPVPRRRPVPEAPVDTAPPAAEPASVDVPPVAEDAPE